MPGSASSAKILIGIPSFRRPDGLRRLLASLAEQRGVEEHEIEVFVADNDAIAREASAVCNEKRPQFRWPLSCEVVEERGISTARNAILAQARACGADFIAMLDDDEVATPDWLRALLDMQQRTSADVVGGPVKYHLDSTVGPLVRQCDEFIERENRPGIIPLLDSTENLLLSCAALARCGWPQFDSAFGLTGGGDKEFFVRAKRAGMQFAWAPDALGSERVPATRANAAWLVRRAYRVGNSDLRITRIHGGRAGTLASIGKAAAILVSAPLASPLLLLPSHRLWLLRKWARSAGKFSALFARHYNEYAYEPAGDRLN
jgi:glycosyltransferase involved in cell wall biosynthesis